MHTDLVIKAENLTKIYQMGEVEVQALRGASLQVKRGELLAIMGPSGSGKSTLMNILGCLDQPTSGQYYLEGLDVSQLDDNKLAQIRGKRIGFVFQSFNLLPRTSALSNVELPLIYSGVGARERHRQAATALGMVGLGDRLHHKPNELSGGQQQRVAIARALVANPALVLADEPTGNLDTRASDEIATLLRQVADEWGRAVVMVTHDPRIAAYADRIIFLKDGAIADETILEPKNGQNAEVVAGKMLEIRD
jgi:putative ABC transport system ATP-binding protein